jgi:hypothetical protein
MQSNNNFKSDLFQIFFCERFKAYKIKIKLLLQKYNKNMYQLKYSISNNFNFKSSVLINFLK